MKVCARFAGNRINAVYNDPSEVLSGNMIVPNCFIVSRSQADLRLITRSILSQPTCELDRILIPCERSCSKSVMVDRNDDQHATESLVISNFSVSNQRVVLIDQTVREMLKVIDAVRDNRGGF